MSDVKCLVFSIVVFGFIVAVILDLKNYFCKKFCFVFSLG